ncbi:MAG TPA: hypothetical protein V6D15_10515 [Oculatellaceae cyanobacterium]|jgi:hypothetical protein
MEAVKNAFPFIVWNIFGTVSTGDNTISTTPDGEEWLPELYTKVFQRISDRGVDPFLLATAESVNPQQVKKKQDGNQ